MREVVTSWRIASSGRSWEANDISGNGSARRPGRWNSSERPILYSSSTIALACLETLVHLAGIEVLPFPRKLVRITIPWQHWQQRKICRLEDITALCTPVTPLNPGESVTATRAWGDAWLLGLDSLVAEVPSVIVPEESNLLLNPLHPGHDDVMAEIVRPWAYDARLLPLPPSKNIQTAAPWAEPVGSGEVIEMIPIQAGEFLMGSQVDEADRDSERPKHPVRLQQFHLSKTPITQAQWRAVAALPPAQGQNWERNLSPDPSEFGDQQNSDKRPVEKVSWYDAIEFCKRLRRLTGKNYSLPSEAQWEYACRAGTTTAYSFGHEFAQSHANIRTKETTPVGVFPANTWGLHDMHGNVWEWCADHWHDNYTDAPNNGKPWIVPYAYDEFNRLVRGGSWKDDTTSMCRSAIRDYWRADYIAGNVGFRICCFHQTLPHDQLTLGA